MISTRNIKSYNEIVNIVSSKQAKSPKVKYKENIKCYLCLELFIKYIYSNIAMICLPMQKEANVD